MKIACVLVAFAVTLRLVMTLNKDSWLIDESRRRLESYAINKLEKYRLHQDPKTYCFTATYPPLKAMLGGEGPTPFSSKLPDSFRLYLHFPFCSGRCSFCHFNVSTAADHLQIQTYKAALMREINQIGALTSTSHASSVYIGGGTPSLLSSADLSEIVGNVRGVIAIPKEAPFTLEVHPEILGSKGEDYLRAAVEIGVNRISIGVQDFDESVLVATGRRHTPDQAEAVIQQALALGLNVNIDLLSPLPHQTPQSWQRTLSKAFAMGVDTITLYTTSVRDTMALSADIKAGTSFPSQADAYLFYIMAQAMAKSVGYTERSSRWFYKDKQGSEKDRTFFAHEPVLGLGCGAYGFIHDIQYYNLPTIGAYTKAVENSQWPTWKSMHLSPTERLHRELILSARDGHIRFSKFRILFDVDLVQMFREKWVLLEDLELARIDSQSCQLTDKGRMLSDEVASFFTGQEVLRLLRENQTQSLANRWDVHLNHFYDL